MSAPLVVVFLRGGLDGLSLLRPPGDELDRARRQLAPAVPAESGSRRTRVPARARRLPISAVHHRVDVALQVAQSAVPQRIAGCSERGRRRVGVT